MDATSPTTAIEALADLTLQTKQDALQTKEELNKQLEQTKQDALQTKADVVVLKRELALSTQNDAECGRRVLACLANDSEGDLQVHIFNVEPVPRSAFDNLTPAQSALYNDQVGEGEDDEVNRPLNALLVSILKSCAPVLSSHFTGSHSPIKDRVGREQRSDLTIADGPILTAATVVTMLDGKLDLHNTAHRNSAIGQAVRRCKALNRLQAGSGRAYAIVPVYDRTTVGFVKVTADMDVCVSMPELMLEKGQDEQWRARDAFRKLLRVLTDPTVNGYRRCAMPSASEHFDYNSAVPLVMGRSGRKLFRVSVKGVEHILKVQAADKAETEHAALCKLASVRGIPTLRGSLFRVTVGSETLTGMLMTPVGVVPSPGTLLPSHAAQLALVLKNAHAFGVVHGDVSPDNIVKTAADELFIIDWGSSSSSSNPASSGFQGKYLFASERIVATKLCNGGDNIVPTHVDDLESLYYCCVVWALGDVEWGRAKGLANMRSTRKQYYGSGRVQVRYSVSSWDVYLSNIRRALFPLDGADADCATVQQAFANVVR